MAPSLSRIMNWNICSGNKRKDPLIEFLRSQGVDVCIITETHLNKDIEFTIDGYHVVRKDRITGEKRGGVMILIRNGISFQQIEIKTSVIESVGIEVKLANKKLKIYAVYCPEQCKKKKIAHQFTSDLQMLTRSQDKFLVIGDLNAKSRKWSDNEENRNGALLLEDISNRGGYEVKLPKEPTFVNRGNASYLDICLTNLTTEHDDRPVTVSTLCSDHHYPTIWDIGEKVRDVASRQEEHHRDENDRQVRVLYPGPGLESVEDADIGLEVLCQAIETVIRSSVHKIAAEAHNLFLINTIKDNGITDTTRNQLAITGGTLKTRNIVLSDNAITRVLSSMVKNMPKTPSDVLNAILSQLNSDGAIQKVRYPSNSRIGERSAMVMELFQHLTAIRRMQKNVSGRRRACLANPLESISLHHDQALFQVKSLAGFRPSIRTSREQQTDDTQYCNLRKRLKKRLSENRASSSTMAIFILREIRRKSKKNPNIHVLFVNLSSSYASINRESLWEFLSDCLSKKKNLIQQVRTVVDRTTPDLQFGLKQNDELSKLLMAIAMDKVIREATTDMDLRIICYEDDVVLIAKNFSELHKAGKNIKKDAKKIGMVMNVKYLKSIDVAYPQTVSPVDKYEFLGSMFHHDNQPIEEINHRILIGTQVFEQWREILMSPAKTIDEKSDVHNKIITSVLEGLESSVLLKKQTEALEKFEYKVLQKINGLVQTGDGKSYYPTYPTLVQKWLKCGIVPLAKQRMLRLAGQIVQIPENRPARIAINSVAQDRRYKQWNDSVEQFLNEIGFQNWNDWQTEAQDPVKWGRVLDKATEYYSKKT